MPDDRHGGAAAVEHSTEQATRAPGINSPWRPFLLPERLDQIGSTNAELRDRAAAGAPEGTVVLADRQLAGQGRLGRRWVDHPGGSVLCSILFRPPWPIEEWYLVPWVVALSAIEACGIVTGVNARCKWPNDLLVGPDQNKVAGILSESVPGGALVVGIGINCNWPADFPPRGSSDAAEIAARATSLDRASGGPVDRDRIADQLLQAVSRRWGVLRSSASQPERHAVQALRADYRYSCATIGELVRVELPDETLTGRALDVDDHGRLLLDVGACVRIVEAGDVVHLRSGAATPAD
ncbi:MAG: biotin--[acetyl-CoA-carboxylase] ligase [Acidimicrobiales bacterium]